MKRIVAGAIVALCSAMAHAYQPGDAVDPAALRKLQVEPAKVTIIDFFAEWCVSCRKELPLISALHDRLGDGRVQFVGVDTDDVPDVAERFQKELRDQGHLSFKTLNDHDQALVKSFKPRGYPALFIIQDGKIARAHLGAIDNVDAVIERDLKSLGAF